MSQPSLFEAHRVRSRNTSRRPRYASRTGRRIAIEPRDLVCRGRSPPNCGDGCTESGDYDHPGTEAIPEGWHVDPYCRLEYPVLNRPRLDRAQYLAARRDPRLRDWKYRGERVSRNRPFSVGLVNGQLAFQYR